MPTPYLPDLKTTKAELTTPRTRIRITTRKHRITNARKPAHITEALDFWSFAGSAANVVLQLGWPGGGLRRDGVEGRVGVADAPSVEAGPHHHTVSGGSHTGH